MKGHCSVRGAATEYWPGRGPRGQAWELGMAWELGTAWLQFEDGQLWIEREFDNQS